jgi:hypothetical protein
MTYEVLLYVLCKKKLFGEKEFLKKWLSSENNNSISCNDGIKNEKQSQKRLCFIICYIQMNSLISESYKNTK